MKIVVDNREKLPLWTEDVVKKKLDVGDYSIVDYEELISVERKNMLDLFSTVGGDHARFKRELKRAEKLDFFAVVIENDITSCIYKNFDGAAYTQMEGTTVLKIMITLLMKYDIPFFFVNSREEARKLILHMFDCYLRLKGRGFEFKR